MKRLQEIIDAVVAGNIRQTEDLVRQAICEGIGIMQIINEGLTAGLELVGDGFKTGEFFLPEMMVSAIAAKEGIEVATEDLISGEYQPKSTIILGTVKDDLHDIGKNLVTLVLRARGFKVIDLGVDIHDEEFINAVKEHKPEFLGMSCLMTTTMMNMKGTIETLVEAKLRNTLKVIVGGCPVSEEFAVQIGADGYGHDAVAAADLVEKWLGEMKDRKNRGLDKS